MKPLHYRKAQTCDNCGNREIEDGDTLYCVKYERDVYLTYVCDSWED